MTTATRDREPNWDSFQPEMRRLVEQIRQKGSDSLTEMQRMLIVEIFRAATMTTEPRVVWVRKKIQEAHLDYCFRLPAMRGK
jgi:hypothetical protein